MAGGSSCILFPRRLRTVKLFRLKSSSGSVDKRFDARKILSLGSSRVNTPSVTGGTRVNAARGRIVAFEIHVRFRDLGKSVSTAKLRRLRYPREINGLMPGLQTEINLLLCELFWRRGELSRAGNYARSSEGQVRSRT
jgi:hypothetical protein